MVAFPVFLSVCGFYAFNIFLTYSLPLMCIRWNFPFRVKIKMTEQAVTARAALNSKSTLPLTHAYSLPPVSPHTRSYSFFDAVVPLTHSASVRAF